MEKWGESQLAQFDHHSFQRPSGTDFQRVRVLNKSFRPFEGHGASGIVPLIAVAITIGMKKVLPLKDIVKLESPGSRKNSVIWFQFLLRHVLGKEVKHTAGIGRVPIPDSSLHAAQELRIHRLKNKNAGRITPPVPKRITELPTV